MYFEHIKTEKRTYPAHISNSHAPNLNVRILVNAPTSVRSPGGSECMTQIAYPFDGYHHLIVTDPILIAL